LGRELAEKAWTTPFRAAYLLVEVGSSANSVFWSAWQILYQAELPLKSVNPDYHYSIQESSELRAQLQAAHGPHPMG
jgi:hypothetical protein